jgi:hypothetical protein
VVHRPARIRYYTGDTLTFTSPEQPPPADRGPRLDWLNPEVPHSVENIDSLAYEAFRIEFAKRSPPNPGSRRACLPVPDRAGRRAAEASVCRRELTTQLAHEIPAGACPGPSP